MQLITTYTDALGGFKVSMEIPSKYAALHPINEWTGGDSLLFVDPGRVAKH